MAKLKDYVQSLIEQEKVRPINMNTTLQNKIFAQANKPLVLCVVDGIDFVLTQEAYKAYKLTMNKEQRATHTKNYIDASIAAYYYDDVKTVEDVLFINNYKKEK